MRNYYGEMQDRLNKYRVVHKDKPRIAILKSIIWNFFFLFKLPTGDQDEGIVYMQDPMTNLIEQTGREQTSNYTMEIDGKKVFRVALAEGGGLGDALLDTQLLKTISELNTKNIKIDFYCRSYKLFDIYPFIDNAYPYSESIDKAKYDLILIGHRFMIIHHMCDDKVKEYSPILFEYCCDSRKLIEHDLSNNLNDNIISQYALLKGKNRIEQCNINDILPMDRYSSKYMSINPKELSVLKKYNLLGKKYIVLNREVDGKYDNNHPKLWSLEKYNRLVKLIKQKYPDILIVQMGTSNSFGKLSLIDVDLVEKTNLEQCKIVLKYSLLLFASEGGLVHLKNFLYGKSVVIFGPTIPEIFGYEENINIRSNACPHTCEWVTDQWAEKCILGYQDPVCTRSIELTDVYEAIEKLLAEKSEYKYTIDEYIEKMTPEVFEKIIKNNNKKICAIGYVSEKMLQIVLDNEKEIYCYIDRKKTRERCNNIKEIYGNMYNIPAEDNTYQIAFSMELCEDENCIFSIMELLRIIGDGGRAVIVVKKTHVSCLIDALEKLGINIDASKIMWGKDYTLVIKKERV